MWEHMTVADQCSIARSCAGCGGTGCVIVAMASSLLILLLHSHQKPVSTHEALQVLLYCVAGWWQAGAWPVGSACRSLFNW